MNRFRIAVAGLLALLGSITVAAPDAGATPAQEYWIATAYGTIQGVYDVNHHWAEWYNSSGQLIFRAYDTWLPWFCSQIEWMSGNFYTGVPAQVGFWNPGLGSYVTGENGLHGCWIVNPQDSSNAFLQIKVTPQGCHNTGNCASSGVSYAGSLYYNTNNVYHFNDCTWLGNCTRGDDHRGVLVIS